MDREPSYWWVSALVGVDPGPQLLQLVEQLRWAVVAELLEIFRRHVGLGPPGLRVVREQLRQLILGEVEAFDVQITRDRDPA